MKRKIATIFCTIILGVIFSLNAFALTDEECTIRKRAYYAGIDNTVLLLSNNLGNLKEASIEKIIVTTLQDFTSEEDVKQNVTSEAGKLILDGYTVDIAIQFSAKDGETVYDYVFNHCLPAGKSYELSKLADSNLTTYNYNNALSYFSDYGHSIGNGVAQTTALRNTYYLDINLEDYKNSGYTLSLPYPVIQKEDSTQTEQTVGTPSIEEAAPQPNTNESVKAVEQDIPQQQEAQTESAPAVSSGVTSKSTGTTTDTSSLRSTTTAIQTVPQSAYKKVGILVWIPTHGGKRYHRNSSCSGMVSPRRVDLGEAKYLGFTACGRCYR